jgi:Mg/Co/Ni transporter MgtE
MEPDDAADLLGDLEPEHAQDLLSRMEPDEAEDVRELLTYADESFDTMLEIGFASAIQREWAWRTSRGESTANLAAFRHLAEGPSDES